MTVPLTGPEFGSYAPDEVTWLLKDLSHADLEGDIAEREARIQRVSRTTRSPCRSSTSPTPPTANCSTRHWPAQRAGWRTRWARSPNCFSPNAEPT